MPLMVGSSSDNGGEDLEILNNGIEIHTKVTHHPTDYPMTSISGNVAEISKTAYNYAVLADDVVGESALLSTSEDVGYLAERESGFNSRNSSYQESNFYDEDYDDEDNNENGQYHHNHHHNHHSELLYSDYNQSDSLNYGSITDHHSTKSDASDSILLNEAREEHVLIKWYKRPSTMMIGIVLFLYTFSIGISLTSEIQLLLYAMCWLKNGEAVHCHSPEIQQISADLQKWTSTITAMFKILVSANIGALSDIYGRKPLILYTFALSLLSRLALLFVFTPRFFSPTMYIMAQVIDAFGGSIFVILAVANSYVVDVVYDSERLHSLGRVAGGLFLGMASGPALSSLMSLSAQVLLQLSVVMLFISTIVVLIWLPESRSTKLRRKSRRESTRSQSIILQQPKWYNKLGLTTIMESFISLKLLWITRRNPTTGKLDLSARINVLYLLIVEILVTSCQIGAGAAVALYCIYWYSWNQNKLGLLVGSAAGLRALILNFFNPWFNSKLKATFSYHSTNIDFIDIITISLAIISLILATASCCIFTSETGIIFYVLFSAFEGIASPTIHATILKYNSNPGKNGAFFGALALIRSLVNLISPILFLTLYVWSFNTWRPLVFGVMALFGAISGVLIFCLRMDS